MHTCCRKSSVFRVLKTLLFLHFDGFLSWLVVKTVQRFKFWLQLILFWCFFPFSAPISSKWDAFSHANKKYHRWVEAWNSENKKYFSLFWLHSERSHLLLGVRRLKQEKNHRKVEAEFIENKIFLSTFMLRAKRVHPSVGRIFFSVVFVLLIRCRYCQMKNNIDFKVAPSIFLMSKMKNNVDFRFSALFFLNHFV